MGQIGHIHTSFAATYEFILKDSEFMITQAWHKETQTREEQDLNHLGHRAETMGIAELLMEFEGQ